MKFKTYLKLLFHVIVTMMILMLPADVSCILLYNRIPIWAVSVSGVISGSISLFLALKYMTFIIKKDDLFKDMF